MNTWALVEISSCMSRGARRQLVAASYRASRRGGVRLLLRGLSRSDVDGMLDSVVREEGVDVFGVQYHEGKVEDITFGEDLIVIATSSEWKANLASRGVPFLTAREGLDLLESTGRNSTARRARAREA